MANPQKENGNFPVANEIAEALAKINLRPYESRTVWAVWRKTWGWHKKEDKISLTQFQGLTGLERRNQHKALKTLVERNIIIRKREGYIVTYGFQKDYTKWQGYISTSKVVSKHTPLEETGSSVDLNTTPVSKHTPKVVSESTHTKENKETIQKKKDFSHHLLILKTQVIQLAEQYNGDRDLIKQHFLKEGYAEEQIEEYLNKYADVLKQYSCGIDK
jgi:phage replication O-like protein O